MAFYVNNKASAPLRAIEFIASPQGNTSIFYCNSTEADAWQAKLAALGQDIIARTEQNGAQLLISKSDKTEAELLQSLGAQGQSLTQKIAKREFQPWKWRGYLSDAGMIMTLVSSKAASGKIDSSKATFAGLSLAANGINKIYGAQKENDPHRLALLEQQADETLKPGMTLATLAYTSVSPEKARASVKERGHQFLSRYSVRFGEIGLRIVGSLAMIFSPDQLKQMGEVRKAGEVVEKFSWRRAAQTMAAESPKTAFGLLSKNKNNLLTGIIYTAGRSMNFIFSKTPDPYNPKPKTVLDEFREHYSFKLSSIIEASAAATMAAGAYKKRDWIGTVGGTSISAGLLTRFAAPFGIREVDMEKLYMHVADDLAHVPEAQRLTAAAHAASLLSEQLQDKRVTFGTLFSGLMERMQPQLAENEPAKAARVGKPAERYTQKIRQAAPAVQGL